MISVIEFIKSLLAKMKSLSYRGWRWVAGKVSAVFSTSKIEEVEVTAVTEVVSEEVEATTATEEVVAMEEPVTATETGVVSLVEPTVEEVVAMEEPVTATEVKNETFSDNVIKNDFTKKSNKRKAKHHDKKQRWENLYDSCSG